MTDSKTLAEAIAGLLSRESRAADLKARFDSYMQIATNSGSLSEVINFPIQRYYGRTLVHIAAFNGLPQYLDYLLKNGGDPDKPSSLPDLCQGYSQCIEVLLSHGAQLRVENSRRVTPVELARGRVTCERVFRNAIAVLLLAKVEIPNRTQDQLQRVKDLHELLDEDNSIEVFKSTYLRLAMYEKDLGARWTDWFQHTLLYRAVDKQREEAVEFLLSLSSNTPLGNLGNGDTPLLAACYHSNIKLVTLLMKHSPTLCFCIEEKTGLTPLHISCSRGNAGIVKIMLQAIGDYYRNEESTTNLNKQDRIGRTPLFNACYHGRIDVVKDLLEFKRHFPKKLDINISENGGRTPLHAAIAASRNSKEMVTLLLQHSELSLNAEAKPSSRANKCLLKLLQRSRSSSEIAISDRDPQVFLTGQPRPQQDSPTSSPVTCSPLESPYSDDHDMEVGVFKSRHSIESSLSPKAHRSMILTATLPNQSTPTTPPSYPPSTAVGIYQLDNGRLQVSEEENASFNNMMLTPLAEACVFHCRENVEQLLAHGAIDKNSVASQICSLIKQSELLQLILSHQCSPLDDDQTEEHPQSSYHLKWKGKHLQTIRGSWLGENSTFRCQDNDDDINVSPCHLLEHKNVSYSKITKVSLGHNYLMNVPLELFQLPNVITIDISENNLISLPEPPCQQNSWSCDHLTFLNLSANSLTSLPSCLWVLPAIAHVIASRNKLESLSSGYDPSHDKQLSKTLVEIDLSRNNLSVVSEFLFMFPRVTKISLAHNKLVSLPDALWLLESLQELDVSHNQLESLPFCETDELHTFGSEETGLLDIATPMNDLNVTLREDLSYQASIYSKKKETSANNSPGKSFKIKRVTNVDVVQQEATVEQSCDYSSLSFLNISSNCFIHFPSGLPCLAPNLTELNISNNRIQSIDIVFLPQSLRKLTAKSCMIERIGNTLMERQLKSVHRKCYHAEDAAICLHRSHISLQFLQTLELSNNELKRIQLLQHAPLKRKTQDVTENELTYQQGVTVLNLLYPSLEGLNLTCNQLTGELNPHIGKQTQLKWIRLSGNTELQRIPLEIAHLKNMRSTFTELEIRDLPNLVEPPVEYHDPNMQVGQILVYLRSKLKHSVPYRTLKLFLIGKGERGKTTLLRRLKESGPGETDRTEGIDIDRWECRGKTGMTMFRTKREPIQFLAWDFAGQDVYHVTHQLFYSRRALYLAVFRLSDGSKGIDELDPWLRNVQLRAPGCIVIVVGTHLDQVNEAEKLRLEEEVRKRYHKKNEYPQVVACFSVSCVNRFTNNIDNLRQLIYEVACKLKVVSKDGDSLEYRKDLKENDQHALLQQQIPASFLQLQEEIHKVYKSKPKMSDTEFRQHFSFIFDDEEELNEAVHYLTLQGTLLHFEDPGLKKLYFLDPEWLAKLMARLINPLSIENANLVEGRISIDDLFRNGPLSFEDAEMSRSYLQLLQKFELVLELNKWEVLIPPLLPEESSFPQPDESLVDVTIQECYDDHYQPPIRRFWLSNYIPEGFWPRLICRVYKDHQINTVLVKYVDAKNKRPYVEWKTWQKGMVFISRGRTLIVLKLVDNVASDNAESVEDGMKIFKGKYRIEINIYIPEMIRIIDELNTRCATDHSLSGAPVPFDVTGDATKVMVAITNHVVSLSSWFIGMVSGNTSGYSPCWKCVAGIEPKDCPPARAPDFGGFVKNNDRLVYCLPIEKCIVPATQEKNLHCSAHGSLKVVHQAPDLIFWDLKKYSEVDSPQKLTILESDVLGKGGFGFVCKGELSRASSSEVETVAVKVFLDCLTEKRDSSLAGELVAMSSKPEQLLHAYKEIRQEVSFLAGLEHSNITKLYGVKTSPTLCLVLELAPKKSLRAMLKEYRERKNVLEPLTLKQSANQIAQGLAYLHSHQIVHLDMKSPNVLVWYFPSANYTKEERVIHAGNVWLKLADYGISQVAPTMLMRMGSTPIGTPGYISPEMFECAGQEVFADKIDVFAYGMVLYELISLQGPFSNQPVHRRNANVMDGKRPPIGSQEKHSPLCVQDLMRLCWSQDSGRRPSMEQCVRWTSAAEFERLRTEITLGSCSSIACTCVNRIEPDLESEWTREGLISTEVNGIYLTDKEIKRFGVDIHPQCLSSQTITESIIERVGSGPSSLTASTEDELTKSNESIVDDSSVGRGRRDSIYVTSASLEVAKSVTKNLLHKKERRDHSVSTPTKTAAADTSYSQIWMCGRDSKKGLLAVFILPDNQKNIYRFFGYIGDEEIQVLCPIRNAVWMGTSKGSIRIVHAPTLCVKYSNKLDGDNDSAILKILHVEEEECVLVAAHNSEVWCFHDRLVGEPSSLIKRQRMLMDDRDDCGPVYDLVKVVINGKVEVWGTMDNNVLVQLMIVNGEWTKTYHFLSPYSHHLKVCSYIVCCSFVKGESERQHHLWISYRNKSGLVCLDACTTKQIGYINCKEALRIPQHDYAYQVNTILAEGRRLLVGTLDGLVAIFDSETRSLLSRYRWHEEKVRSLLILPEQIRTSICAEVGIISKESVSKEKLSKASSFAKDIVSDNKLFVPNKGITDRPLIASIGNGRRRMDIHEVTSHTRHSRPRASTRIGEDITLLLWHS